MANNWGPGVFPEVARKLESQMPAWREKDTKIVLYSAGGHTRDLLQDQEFRSLHLLCIVDRNEELWGGNIDGVPIQSVDTLNDLEVDLVVISSPRAHDSIVRDMAPKLMELAMPWLDLYAGVKPYRLVQQKAKAKGFSLDEIGDGRIRLTNPGSPNRVFILKEQHWIYSQDLLHDFDYYFNAVQPDWENAQEQVVDLSRPAMHTLRDTEIGFWFPSLPEPEITTVAYLDFARIKAGHHIVDLGAYAGGSSYAFAQAVGPEGRVLAVEPDPISFDALKRNIALHGLSQVTPVQAAVWERDEECLFQAEGSLGSSLSATLDRETNLVPVLAYTLETLLAKQRFTTLDFLKMDIEGAELAVVRQAMPLLQRLRPRIVIEPHYLQGVLVTSQLVEVLATGGFSTQLLDQGTENYPLVGAWID